MGGWPILVDYAHLIYTDFQSLGRVKSISYVEEDRGPAIEKRWSITVKSKRTFGTFVLSLNFASSRWRRHGVVQCPAQVRR